ncbi:methyltransferase family protein [Methanobacterium sp. ACI-7]|uniref:methyltransferase family protein n=1 Tax=unclassified Methanobacterium TaxID=2627676 RepID=UPI0039C0B78C
MAFLIPLSYRRKANWIEYSLVSAFFVSLFIEMYGIPLTVLFASKYFFTPGTQLPPNIISFYFLGVGFGMDVAMTYGAILMLIGMFIIIIGWIKLYKSTKKDGLVTDGIYAYSRHPQYLGFIFIILGWLFGWPTIITVILAPILIYKYIRVCRAEEEDVSKEFPEYNKYKKDVPLFI